MSSSPSKSYAYHAKLSPKTRVLNLFRHGMMNRYAEEFLIKRILRDGQSLWTKLVAPEYLYSAGTIRQIERGGLRFKLDISKTVDHIKYFGFEDRGFTGFLSRLAPQDTVVDVGANVGLTVLEIAKRVNQGRVVGFEPSRSNYARLTEHLRLNGCANVTTVNMGVGPKRDTVKLYDIVASNPGMKRILSEGAAEGAPSEVIEIDRLDTQLSVADVQRVNAMKIDVEGFELHVLQSCESVLKRDRPLLFIELDDRNLRGQSQSASELVMYLVGLGYAVTNAASGQVITGHSNLADCHIDILCEHAGNPG